MTSATRTGREPAAIALTPILSARYREEDLARIRAAAPGARLVNVSLEGLSDSPLDDVEVLLRGPMPTVTFDRLLARCSKLCWVHSATAGVERVLTADAGERGLTITNARGVFSEPIAEYTMMMILSVVRRLPELIELQRERTWQPLPARELRQVTIGVVGLGSIGRNVARLALSFGARVIGTRKEPDQPKDFTEPVPEGMHRILGHEQLPELLAESDFVVLTVPLTEETDKLMNGPRLAQMKPGSWLINVARGRLVDQRALLRALRNGPLAGAVLDTLWEEPLPPSSPLWDAPGLIITPHTSWSSGRVLDRSIELFCDNLVRYRDGREMLNLVDPEAGY
jgi:phosphoglycerate dehydrogenase-like enzyme